MSNVNWNRCTYDQIEALSVGELMALPTEDRKLVQRRMTNRSNTLEREERERLHPFKTSEVCGESKEDEDGKRVMGFKPETGITSASKYVETCIALAVLRTAQEIAAGASPAQAVKSVLLSKLYIGRGKKCSAGAVSVTEGKGEELLSVIITAKHGMGLETFQASVPKMVSPIVIKRHTATHQVPIQGSEA